MAATKWHYQVHRGELSPATLDDLGAEGWELVSVVASETGPTYYFKCPHPTLAEQITLEQRARYIPKQASNGDHSR